MARVDGWQFYEDAFVERIRAAQRMGRTVDHQSGWALGYQRPSSGILWTWQNGTNCWPNPLDA